MVGDIIADSRATSLGIRKLAPAAEVGACRYGKPPCRRQRYSEPPCRQLMLDAEAQWLDLVRLPSIGAPEL
jgi:hypothetical protein